MRLVYKDCKVCKGSGDFLGNDCKICRGQGQIAVKISDEENEENSEHNQK